MAAALRSAPICCDLDVYGRAQCDSGTDPDAGLVTGVPLGVRGAGLATRIATATGLAMAAVYFRYFERYLTIRLDLLHPLPSLWCRMIGIGLPAGAKFALMFLSTAVVYYAIREFGAATQAGFGIGSRVLQVILLPGMVIGFAVGPVAAQNFGVKDSRRVREAFYKAALIATSIMVSIAIVARCWPLALVSMFDADGPSTRVAALFLCTNMFQGLGNTLPPLLSSAARFLFFCACTWGVTMQAGFRPEHIWYLLIASITLQATLSLLLLVMELDKRAPRMAP